MTTIKPKAYFLEMRATLSFNGWNLGKWILVLGILFSPIVGFYDLLEFYAGKNVALALKGSAFTRIVRDILIVLFYIYFIWFYIFVLKAKEYRLPKDIDNFLLYCGFVLGLTCISLSIIYSLHILDLPLKVIIIGLKTFLYMPLFLIALLFIKNYPSAKKAIQRSLYFVLAIQLLLGFVQIFYFPPVHGITVLGSMASGTFSHYNIYGAFLCTFLFAHLFISDFKLPKVLLAGVIFMIIANGSRTAVLVMGGLILIWLCREIFTRLESRGLIISLMPFLGLAIIFITPFISHRQYFMQKAGIIWMRGDPRVMLWLEYFQRDLSLPQLLLGSGIGLASNAVTVIYGPDVFPGQFIADGQHLSMIAQYGFLGIVVLYLVLLAFLVKFYKGIGLIFFLVMSLFGMGMIFLEVYPANLIAPILLAFHRNPRKG